MDFDLVALPFRIVSTLFGLVFSLAITEFLVLLFYGAMTDEAAAQALMQNTSDPVNFPGRWVEYVLASPDRTILALVVAAVVTLLALTTSSSWGGED
ncbi:MAG: hypothetical protein V5A44_12000 [Haloarculaceae archaeon]